MPHISISGGGQRSCSSLYLNYGGSRKTISSAYGNIGGSRKQIFPYNATTTYTYTWKKYNATLTDTETNVRAISLKDLGYFNNGVGVYANATKWEATSRGYYIDSYGKYTHTNYLSLGYDYDYFILSNSDPTGTYQSKIYYTGGSLDCEGVWNDSGDEIIDYRLVRYSSAYEGIDILEYGYTMGSYVGTVTSTNSNAYPEDGVSGSYWYVYQGMS